MLSKTMWAVIGVGLLSSLAWAQTGANPAAGQLPLASNANAVLPAPAAENRGVVYVLDGPNTAILNNWGRKYSELSTTTPFVQAGAEERGRLAQMVKLPPPPVVVLTDDYNNVIWAVKGDFSQPAVYAVASQRAAALPQTCKLMARMLEKDSAVALKLSRENAPTKKVMQALLKVVRFNGYDDQLTDARRLYDSLLTDGKKRLADAVALAPQDKAAACKQISALAEQYEGTPLKDQARAEIDRITETPQARVRQVSAPGGGASSQFGENGPRGWIAVLTEQSYISNLTPVVAQGVSAFAPTISSVYSGSVLDVQKPMVFCYVYIHQ